MTKLVPIGLVPLWVREKERLVEIMDAMDRYEEAGVEVPTDWFKEYSTLSTKLMREGHIQ